MQNRLSTLSLALLVMATLSGCWHKKCCKKEESCVERVEDNTCRACPAVIEDEVEDFIDEEFPAAAEPVEHTKERVSGPRGWKQNNLK